jgi:hypothetical protein
MARKSATHFSDSRVYEAGKIDRADEFGSMVPHELGLGPRREIRFAGKFIRRFKALARLAECGST